MTYRYTLEILVVISIIAFCFVFLYTSSTEGSAAFTGSDEAGAEAIAEIKGTSDDKIQPLIPLWVPPSKEIEASLFALQAAAGGLIVGGVFGYWLGQKKQA